MDSLQAENSDFFDEIRIGVGTWAWGDRLFWGYGDSYGETQIEEAFSVALINGIRFFDTAEVYGQGKSEMILGDLLKTISHPVKIASKMMPYPWRIFKGSLRSALKDSLKRLGLQKLDLYQMHYPLKPVSVSFWMNRMADLVEEGLITAVGVSNYNLEQTISAQETLKRRGFRLSSIQVEYNLVNRKIETNGLMNYCRQEKIKIIASSPLAMGVLTGKYSPDNPPSGVRSGQYHRELLTKIQPLLRTMIRVGNEREGKTAGQVALNWAIRKDVLPIPGAKNADQMAENLGVLDWSLDDDEISLLDETSTRVIQQI